MREVYLGSWSSGGRGLFKWMAAMAQEALEMAAVGNWESTAE